MQRIFANRPAHLVNGLLMALLLGAASASAQTSTADRTIVEGPPRDPARPGFLSLVEGPGAPRVVRPLFDGLVADPGRVSRRRSLVYFGQLTDFQLADEESPSRVEAVDSSSSTTSAAWRPQEALAPFAIDASLRSLRSFAARSPVSGEPLNFAVLTGDNADNQQLNENTWVRQLLEGGAVLDPNSGVDDRSSCGPAVAAALSGVSPEPVYMGVQGHGADFYDPSAPSGQWAAFPRWGGLLDRAQQAFRPVGLGVPTYVANGNHDGLVQGNEDANRAIEDVAIGCVKVVGSSGAAMFVPPDRVGRSFVDKRQLKEVYAGGSQADAHGFAFVSRAESEASAGAASYYAWDPRPGMRFIALDTLSEGGVVQQSAEGNIDEPQWQWLTHELEAASEADKLVVLFGHHPIRSLVSTVPDEAAACSGTTDEHGHDQNPGCDLDPRSSTPLHNGTEMAMLLARFPHVIAYVAGHTHENKILGFGAEAHGFWEITTSAIADWPQQHRLIEVLDNRDGTLSIFGTVVDHASPLSVPPDTDDASGFSVDDLAGIARSLSYNDPQAVRSAGGAPEDRNVELVVPDPRRGSLAPAPPPANGIGEERCPFGAAFSSASVRARGRRLRLRFRRLARPPVRVDVVRVPSGRRVARFRNRLVGFGFSRPVPDGIYVVRFRGESATGHPDVRRFAVRRRRGRWHRLPPFARPDGCGLVRSFALSRPVFPLRVRFALARGAPRARVELVRRGRVVRRGRRFSGRGLRPGRYAVQLRVGARVVSRLYARRL